MWGQVNGWNSGIDVSARYNEKTQMDEFTVTLNEGNGYNQGRRKTIGTFTQMDLVAPKLKPVNWVEVDDLAQDIEKLPYQVYENANRVEAGRLAVKMKDVVRRAAKAGIETP